MKKCFLMLLLLFVGAIPSMATGVDAQSDTTSIFVLNGKEYPLFTGAELEGKTIKSYKITFVPRGGRIFAMHNITTKDKKVKALPKSIVLKEDHIIILNGKEVSPQTFKKVFASRVSHVTVFKAGGESTVKQFGERGKDHNFIIVETK